MKVLLISPLPPPVGGIATWTENILDFYDLENNSVNILLMNTALKFRSITNSSFIYRLFTGLIGFFLFIFKYLYFLLKEKPDVIHNNTSGSLGLIRDFLLILIAKYMKIPVVTHFHFGRIPELSRAENWEWKILKAVVKLSSSVIVLDSASLKVLNNIHLDNIYLVPNPISKDLENLMDLEINRNSSLLKNNIRIIFVGHLIEEKGIFELVKAVLKLVYIVDLVLIGPYESAVREKIVHLLSGSKNVKIIFKGSLTKFEVLSEMQNSTLLTLPSYTEGFPNVVIEAMAMKCPIVATNVGAIPNILDIGTSKPAGFVIEPKNVEALTKALNLVISNPNQAKNYAKNAFSKVKNDYTLEKVCKRYEIIWNNPRK